MSILDITKCDREEIELPKICDLDYGTFVTGVPSGNDCVYVKVKKKSRDDYRCGKNRGIGLQWDSGKCVLFNLTYGTLRQIPAKTRVMPLKPVLKVTELKPREWTTVKKDYTKGDC
jgi:hypothetical protein